MSKKLLNELAMTEPGGRTPSIGPQMKGAFKRFRWPSPSLDRPANSLNAARLCSGEDFDQRVTERLADRCRRDVLALIELQDPDAHFPPQGGGPPSVSVLDPTLITDLTAILLEDDWFCCRDGRIHVLLSTRNGGDGLRRLRRIGRRLSARKEGAASDALHPTPAIGYLRLDLGQNAEDLFRKTESALNCATSSLEIEPFAYDPKLSAIGSKGPFAWIARTWKEVPQSVVLSVQFAVTLIFGLGAPFLLYATFDALGFDITGPVYIGVVIVLLITATSIWIEGFLALRRTEPPAEPGAPYPVATVVIPAYLPNEQKTIVETLNAFLKLDYPNLVQVIVAYNSLGPRLPVEDELELIAKANAGSGRFVVEPIRVAGSTSKAQNVNAVIGRVRGAFVGIYDADHHPLPDSLCRAWRWLSNGWDIVQGRCSIRNGDESWVARMVAVEFEQIYAVSHPGRARLHGFGIFGGSNGFWRTSALHQTRMRVSMLTEDIDSSIRALEGGFRIAGDRDLISEELAPTSLRPLINQRLRWAQGWFQVSLQRILPTLRSRKLSLRQKIGLVQLLVWRELFPWYSIQVIPILGYWVWVYGWSHIDWAIPVFLFTTIYTFSVGPGQVFFAYLLSRKTHVKKVWFLEYLFTSTLLYAPFKDTLSRIAHLKEGMGERTWRVTPRLETPKLASAPAYAAGGAALVVLLAVGQVKAATPAGKGIGFSPPQLSMLIGGEASTIRGAREAARANRNAEAASLFDKAIRGVPRRRAELLPEFADALTYSGRSSDAVPLYREAIASARKGSDLHLLRLHLALALGWSGQNQAALLAYDDLLAERPGDASLIVHRARVLVTLDRQTEALSSLDRVPASAWASGPLGELGDEILLGSARNAATDGGHELSANLFERAVRHDAGLRPAVLREWADQLLLSRRPALAATLYREALDRRMVSGTARTDAAFGLSQALALSGRPAESYRAFLAALAPEVEGVGGPGVARAARSPGQDFEIVIHSNAVASGRLIEAAKLAAAADQRSEASQLAKRASMACVRCKDPFLRELADQAPGGRSFQRNLALSASANPAAALSAWTAVLRTSPNDADARIHLAQALSQLNRHEEALQAYVGASDVDRRSEVARRGVFDETVTLARVAAQDDRNSESAAKFASAISLNDGRRREVIREYADQLVFSGRAGDAVPLYQEALSSGILTPLDHRRAVTGLADAYTALRRPADGLAGLAALRQRSPGDVDSVWAEQVFGAREAARTDRNAESARLFASALATDAARAGEIRREYADQLRFSDRSEDAVPIYRAVLEEPTLPGAERKTALKGLAEALTWSKQPVEALATYDLLVKMDPDDVGVGWSRLVLMAREAAQTDQNKESANLFFEAVRLDPVRSDAILREYADQISFMGRPGGAIPVYRKALATQLLASDRFAAQKGLAQAEEWAGRLSEAQSLYASLAAAHPEDASLQWRLLVVSAREAGRKDENTKAAELFAKAIKLVPERREVLLEEYADKLTFSDRSKEAVPLYRELVLKSGSLRSTRTRKLRLDLARALTWSHQYEPAIAEYRDLARVIPQDLDVRNSLARALQWSGRQVEAKATFQQVLLQDPANAEGQRGLAQVEDWQGHHRIAQAILEERLRSSPDDLEARHLLAQSEVWLGRPDKAAKVLQVGLEARISPRAEP